MTTQAPISLAGKAFFGGLCVGTFGLGVWQTQRYYEKVNLMREREKELRLEPSTTLDKNSFRRTVVQGQFLHHKQFLVGPRGPPAGALPDKPGSSAQGMSSSPQGFFVMCPFQIDKHNTIIVNRGWVPRVVPSYSRPEGLQTLTVVANKPEEPKSFLIPQHPYINENPPKLYWFDESAMRNLLDVSAEDELTMAVATRSDTDEESKTWPVIPPVESIAKFKTTPEIHAGYAVTWYGLSLAGVVMTRILLRR